MEGAILLVVAVVALGAFVTGIVLLVLYFRAGRRDSLSRRAPTVYGEVVQCPKCGTINPVENAACVNCRAPLPYSRGNHGPQPFAPTIMGEQPQAAPPAPLAPAHAQPSLRPAVQHPVPGRPANMPHAWLEGTSGAMLGRQAVLQQADTLIGRSTVCDVQVFDPKISRRHIRIRYANGAFYLQDQQSSRGTLVNGERVMAQRLNNGDHIVIGDTGMTIHIQS